MPDDPQRVPGGWHTFREIDEAEDRPKGQAFRCFKTLEGSWAEGKDYVVLEAAWDAARIIELKRQGRLYPGTVNAVLLSPGAASEIRAALHGGATH